MSNSTSTPRLSRRDDLRITGRIVAVIAFNFVAYLTIGLPLAVLPGFVHTDLGFGSVVAGAAISVQYLATLVTRPLAGRSSDARGSKITTLHGLAACATSGVVLLAAAIFSGSRVPSFALLILSRLILGLGESFCATGATTWGIARVGMASSARVISWNGIATYGALALGAPLGVVLAGRVGFASLGVSVIVIAGVGFAFASRIDAVPVVLGERASYRSVFLRVVPHGLGLALGSVGFGSIATFVTLFYAAHHWPDAALSLSVFGGLFVCTRLAFPRAIATHGGYRVCIVSFAVETLGLLMLWRADTPLFALAGAALTGSGFALVFPALGVEAIQLVPPTSRGAALSAYSVFFDLALGVTGPVAGYVAGQLGYGAVYLVAAVASALAVALTFALLAQSARRNAQGTAETNAV